MINVSSKFSILKVEARFLTEIRRERGVGMWELKLVAVFLM